MIEAPEPGAPWILHGDDARSKAEAGAFILRATDRSTWASLRNLLDRIERHPGRFGTWTEARRRDDDGFNVGYPTYEPVLTKLIDFVHANSLLCTGIPYLADAERVVSEGDHAVIESASLVDALLYRTYMVRSDRFNEGALITHLNRGLVQAALRRILDFAG